jgi:hypothetical protein
MCVAVHHTPVDAPAVLPTPAPLLLCVVVANPAAHRASRLAARRPTGRAPPRLLVAADA